MILSYRYRIEPNKTQAIALSDMLGDFCQLYNAALEHRINAYKRGVTRCDYASELPWHAIDRSSRRWDVGHGAT